MTTYALAAFAKKMRILSDSFTLGDGEMKVGRTRGGEIVRAQNGSRLWHGSITLAPHYPSEMREVGALVRALQEPDAFFEIHDPFAAFPASDPTGSAISGSSPIVSSVGANGTSINLSGLPSGYKLKPGDRLGVQYTTTPGKLLRGYYEIQNAKTASGGGSVAGVVIAPSIPSEAAAKAARFAEPRCLAMLVPGSVRPAVRSRGIEQGWSFDWVQVPIL